MILFMSIRDLLRNLPVFASPLPSFSTEMTPDEPNSLFEIWLDDAIAAGVSEPHAMTLSTVDADGRPDARVVILKDLDEQGWSFATSATSAKGRQLAAHPLVALSFHWRERARQVRVRGTVTALDAATAAQDFLARPEGSRVATLVGRQSSVLADPVELRLALDAARQRIADDPLTVATDHTVYRVRPTAVEFWQGEAERRHVRLRYLHRNGAWAKDLLWP
jgi:pyridoxamine 5'-phosphate oxidase